MIIATCLLARYHDIYACILCKALVYRVPGRTVSNDLFSGNITVSQHMRIINLIGVLTGQRA
jgi:hypothetical protein